MKRSVMQYSKVILLLVALDVGVKLIIEKFFIDNRFYICDNVGFVPKLNTKELSVFNLVFKMGVDIKILIIGNIAFFLLLLGIFFWEMKKSNTQRYVKAALITALSASICSLVDKVYWGGSLDYILVFSYIVDLKDLYIGIACIIAVVGTLKESCDKRKNSIVAKQKRLRKNRENPRSQTT